MDKMCPIVFLDIDGVLHSFNYEQYLINHNKDWYDQNGAVFDPNCVATLDNLIKKTQAKIVISSSWKDSRICKDALYILKEIWKYRNLSGEIIGVTPTLTPDELQSCYGIRTTQKWKGYEIDQWLKYNPQYHLYIIIDDQDVVLDSQKPFFILTNGNKGLQNKDVKKAVKIFAHSMTKERKTNLMTWVKKILGKKQ